MASLLARLRALGNRCRAALERRFALYPATDPMAPLWRARQLQAVLRMTPRNMAVNIAGVLLVGFTFWNDSARWPLALWGLLVLAFALIELHSWRTRPAPPTASGRALRRVVLHAALLALMWGGLVIALLARADSAQQLLLATLIAGMLSAGGFSLATVPLAGTAWVAILTLAALLAVAMVHFPLALPLGGLLLLYGFIVASGIWSAARTFCDRLAAEAHAEQQRQVIGLLLRDFEEHASDVLWETDARGHLTHSTARQEQAFGLPAAQLAAEPLFALLTRPQDGYDEQDLRAQQALRLRLAEGAPFRDQTLPLQRGEEKTWWSLTARPLHDAQERFAGWRGVATDVTERVQTQQEQRSHRAWLERQVHERTVKLNEAMRSAHAANRAKSLFLSSMSHELRTPLNAVLGYAQLLRLAPEAGAEVQEAAGEIERAGQHLLALVNDLLDLARIEAGKLELRPEDVPLGEVLAECQSSFAPQLRQHGLTLELAAAPALLRADRMRLRQVLFNLISNAIKYNRPEGRVTLRGAPQTPGRYRVQVSDTGRGIPPERMAELFQPFQRIGAERGNIEGTGIGLVITRDLVRAMGGEIGVESTPGSGSTFWIELPLAGGATP